MKISTIDSEFNFEKKTASNSVEVLVLSINSDKNLESLNFKIPRLKYLEYVVFNNIATLTIADSQLNEIFESLLNVYFDSIEVEKPIEHNLFILKHKIKEFLRAAEKDRGWDKNKLKGFYAELLLLRDLLSKSDDKPEIIAGWQRPNMANHDFTYVSNIHEVKAIALHKESVKITTEHQLLIPKGKNLFLEVFRLEALSTQTDDSLSELYLSVIELLDNPLQVDEFKSKCEEDDVNYCGPDIHHVPYKFVLHEHLTYGVHLDGFPRILPFEDDTISGISYDISLAALNKYKIDFNTAND